MSKSLTQSWWEKKGLKEKPAPSERVSSYKDKIEELKIAEKKRNKVKKEVLKWLHDIINDEQEVLKKYQSGDYTSDHGDDLITEGRLEAFVSVIKMVKKI